MQSPPTITISIAKAVSVLSLLFGLVVGSILISWDYGQLKADFEERAMGVLSAIQKPASTAAYNFDRSLALEVARGLMEFEAFFRVRITNETGEIMIEIERTFHPLSEGTLTAMLFEPQIDYEMSLVMEEFHDGPIGTLHVSASPHQIVDQFWEQARLLIVMSLLQTAALALMVLYMIYQRVSRPLHQFARDFYDLDPQAPAKSLPKAGDIPANAEFIKLSEAAMRMLGIIEKHIEEKDQARRDLKRQKDETERVVSIAETLVLQTSLKGKIIKINPLACQVFEEPEQTMIGKNFIHVAFSDDKLDVRTAFDRLVELAAKGHPEHVLRSQSRLINTQGIEKLIYWQIALHFDFEGRPDGFLISGQDITRLEKVESALKASEGNLRAVIDATSQGYGLISQTSLELVDLNAALEDILGYKRSQLVRSSFTDYVHPEDKLRFLSLLSSASNLNNNSVSIRLSGHHSSEIPCDVILTPLSQETASEPLIIIFVHDLRPQAEQELQKKRLEQELRQAQKMETIGTLAGGIAHDFNNVLTPILGYAAMLKDRLPKDDPNQKRALNIHKSAQRAAEMVSKILTFSRRSEPQMQSRLLTPIIEDTLELLNSVLPAHMALRLKIVKNHAAVLCDSTQIQQLLINLVTNAIHAMEETHNPVLTIALSQTTLNAKQTDMMPGLKSGKHLLLLVRDNGHGMDESTCERIFDPFFTTKKFNKGTGLGLAMVHGIVQSHKGHIEVESAPDQGTTFKIYLPVTNQPVYTEATPLGHILEGQNEHILVIDDDSANMNFLVEALQENGFNASGYTDPRLALDRFLDAPQDIDLIVTDQSMPNLGGNELVAAIRTVRNDIPVIMISGYNQIVGGGNAQDFGIDAFISKPLSIPELSRIIKKLLVSS